jgi:hypothetical protein
MLIRDRLLRMAAGEEQDFPVDKDTGYLVISDTQLMDPETGEVFDKVKLDSEKQDGEKGKDALNRLKKLLFVEKKPMVNDKYRDNNYLNKWGKVSPINILYVDHLNDILGMPVESAKEYILNTIESLNKEYWYDKKHYSYFSRQKINEIKVGLMKANTIDKVTSYLTNIYFAGIGMGSGGYKKYAGVEDTLEIITCPNCGGHDHYITKRYNYALNYDGTGFAAYDCHCKNCGKDFYVNIEFDYTITNTDFKIK